MMIYVIILLLMSKVGIYLFEVNDCYFLLWLKFFRYFFKVKKIGKGCKIKICKEMIVYYGYIGRW